MSDSYLKFANSKFGSKLTQMLGLPLPLPLRRYADSDGLIDGKVLLGGMTGDLVEFVQAQLKAMNVSVQGVEQYADTENSVSADNSTAADQAIGADNKRISEIDQPVRALIFDATCLTNSQASIELYGFFNQTLKTLQTHGRIIVLGRPPSDCRDSKQAAVQRALEGFTRSLVKEVRRAITVQTIYVAVGAEANLGSSLRFFLSARSAYVSGQVITVSNQTFFEPQNTGLEQSMSGKKVLVTGASQGIGLAIAETFAREGAKLICLDIPAAQTALEQVAARLDGRPIALDLRAENAPQLLCDAAIADGGWDVLVHNAGITQDKTIAKMNRQQWMAVLDINLSAQERINDAMLAAGALNRNGRVVAVSSISGIAGNRGQTNYAFSKAGVIGMVQASADAFAERGMTINAVAPGFIETKMTAAIPFGVREAGRRLNSLSQGGLPVDVAEAILYFAQPDSAGLNGNVLRVCGQSLLGA